MQNKHMGFVHYAMPVSLYITKETGPGSPFWPNLDFQCMSKQNYLREPCHQRQNSPSKQHWWPFISSYCFLQNPTSQWHRIWIL